MRKLKTKDLALISLFVCLQIILTRFCSIQTEIVRIDFNFLAVSMCAALFGPLWGGAAAAAADFLGVTLFPAVGGYFPGFTLSMFMAGAFYGIFLHNKEKSWLRITCAVTLVILVCSLALDTLWIMIIYQKGFIALLPVRLIKCVVMLPLQITLIRLTWNTIGTRISGYAEGAD